MKVLVSELTNTDLEVRIHRIEIYMEKLREKMNTGMQGYEYRLVFKKWQVTLNLYADVIYEAAHRKLITIH